MLKAQSFVSIFILRSFVKCFFLFNWPFTYENCSLYEITKIAIFMRNVNLAFGEDPLWPLLLPRLIFSQYVHKEGLASGPLVFNKADFLNISG